MPDLSERMLAEVIEKPVRRHLIAEALGIKRGVSATLLRHARQLEAPHVLERRHKGRKHEVEYHLRRAGPGEDPARIREVRSARP
jgi:hypothetical protein